MVEVCNLWALWSTKSNHLLSTPRSSTQSLEHSVTVKWNRFVGIYTYPSLQVPPIITRMKVDSGSKPFSTPSRTGYSALAMFPMDFVLIGSTTRPYLQQRTNCVFSPPAQIPTTVISHYLRVGVPVFPSSRLATLVAIWHLYTE